MKNNTRIRVSKQPLVLRYPSDQEATIWLKRRQGTPPSVIADDLGVTRAYVSKSLRKAEKKIGSLLEHAAAINRIKLHHISSKHGMAVGYCAAYKSETVITYSPNLGIQVWFEHRGDCSSCADIDQCTALIASLSTEWNVPIIRNAPALVLVNDLLNTIMKRLEWRN